MRVLCIVFLLFSFAPTAIAAGDYICPMHPHIHGEKEDTCPICGMNLVPAQETKTGPDPEPAKNAEQKILYWYDPMVLGQKFDKPGKSPYMDMDLVPFYEENQNPSSDGALQIESSYQQALGVRTAPVKRHEFGRSVAAFGTVMPSTRREHEIAVRSAGWIIDLKASAVGDTVKKGDLLFTYYSPDLMAAQSDFLVGAGRVGNAEERLRLYGMDDQSIALLKETGHALRDTPFYAPADGTVSMLDGRKGSYLEEGDVALTLQDYAEVWIEASLPVRDLQFLAAGTPAVVALPETGDKFQAAVDVIYPITDPQSRTGTARLVLKNPDGTFKAGALVDVTFESSKSLRLAVPEEAVLYGADGAYVIEEMGKGYFRPVRVRTGLTAHGFSEITAGLDEGRNVVTSGQFMIDAESNLRGGMNQMTGEKAHE
ncbi:MAG: efflux RND transporter periplasmic adaptor subunit [Pseudobdellovibrionaceae bacterium]